MSGINPTYIVLLLGLILVLLEALIPGAHFIVLGVALLGAGSVGVALGGISVPLLAVLVIFFGCVSYYVYSNFNLYGGEQNTSAKTSNADSLSGKSGYVTQKVTDNSGMIRLNDSGSFSSSFQARTEFGEIDEGEEVIVSDPGGGNILKVVPISEIPNTANRNNDETETTESEVDREIDY